MSEVADISAKLSRDNKKTIGWLASFAVLIWIVNSRVVEVGCGPESLAIALAGVLILMLTTLVAMFRYMSSNPVDGQFWGLRLDRQGWYMWLVFLGVAVVNALLYPPPAISADKLLAFGTVAMSVITTEMVLRAFLINYLVPILGSSKSRIFIAIAVSALVTLGVQRPFLDLGADGGMTQGQLLVAGFIAGYSCYYARSMIPYFCFIILALSDHLVQEVTQGDMAYILGITLLLYWLLAAAASYASRRRGVEAAGEPAVQAGG